MKFMRLGSKPDCFTTVGNVTTVTSELESDIVLDLDTHKFHLHLFPLLAKCEALSKIVTDAVEAGEDEVKIKDFPGSAACFEKCAKFCYGVPTTLNAHDVSEVRCGAEFLKMTEMVEKGNLIYKLEVFLNTSILRGWRDSIICLQRSKAYLPWSEDLKIIDRCIESISSKVAVDPTQVDWSFAYTKADCIAIINDHVSVSQSTSPAVWNNAGSSPSWMSPVPADWWIQDLTDLDIDLFWRVMVAVKAKGVGHRLVGEALRVYTLRWLPEVSELHSPAMVTKESATAKQHQHQRQMLETIVTLLPSEKGSASCTFLLKLLRSAITLNLSSFPLKSDLTRRIGLQLEEASVHDLLLPSSGHELYDVDTVMRIVEHYLLQNQSPPISPPPGLKVENVLKRRSRSADHIEFTESRRSTAAMHGSKLKVAELIDGYLAEIARDPELEVGKFVRVAEFVPEFARPSHDGLYRAVDMYLKEHPDLPKSERKKVCRLMDCRKLSIEACMHAARNERLPLRTVVQVLFFEQVRTTATGGFLLSDMPSNIRALLGQDSGDELSISDSHTTRVPSICTQPGATGWHPDFTSMKPGDSAHTIVSQKSRAPVQPPSFSSGSLKPPKPPKGMFAKPKKFFQKLFSKKVSNSASSRESETQSYYLMHIFGKASTGTRRHSIT